MSCRVGLGSAVPHPLDWVVLCWARVDQIRRDALDWVCAVLSCAAHAAAMLLHAVAACYFWPWR